MSELLSIGRKAKSINAISILLEFLNLSSTKEFLIEKNTRDQLFDRGEDSDGVKLSGVSGINWVVAGKYASRTIHGAKGSGGWKGKIEKGLPTDRITLFNDGDLYSSWKIEIDLPFIIFEADDKKETGTLSNMLQTGVKFLGLQDENKREFEEMAIKYVMDKVLNLLLS